MFYHLESWVAVSSNLGRCSTSSLLAPESTSTHLLQQFRLFQKHMTTVMYIFASDSHQLPSKFPKVASVSRQPPAPVIGQVFVNKITRGFLEAIYHFLDGLMVLVSDDAPLSSLEPEGNFLIESGTNLCELVNIRDAVRRIFPFASLMAKLTPLSRV